MERQCAGWPVYIHKSTGLQNPQLYHGRLEELTLTIPMIPAFSMSDAVISRLFASDMGYLCMGIPVDYVKAWFDEYEMFVNQKSDIAREEC